MRGSNRFACGSGLACPRDGPRNRRTDSLVEHFGEGSARETAQFVIGADGLAVAIALPSLQHDLGVEPLEGQWVLSGYGLAFGTSGPLRRGPSSPLTRALARV